MDLYADAPVILWITGIFLLGASAGILWYDRRHSARLDELRSLAKRNVALGDYVQQHKFGVIDLKARIAICKEELAGHQANLEEYRSEYKLLNRELQKRWDCALKLKNAGKESQRQVTRLESELQNWKDRLARLQHEHESGERTEKALKAELSRGLTAISESTATELPLVQQMILEASIDLDDERLDELLGTNALGEIAKLQAKADLLEGLVRYWQDKATGHDPEEPIEFPVGSVPDTLITGSSKDDTLAADSYFNADGVLTLPVLHTSTTAETASTNTHANNSLADPTDPVAPSAPNRTPAPPRRAGHASHADRTTTRNSG